MSDSCIRAAKEAAAKVNAMLLASGQWKPSEISKTIAKPEKTTNLFVEEVVINDAPMSARNYLTRSSTQDEISKMSGASVSTRGRYMSQSEAEKCTSSSLDKPLHLHIQGVNEQDVKVAVGRIMHLIMEHTHRKHQPHPKFRGHRANSNTIHGERSPSKVPPSKVSLDNFAPKVTPPLPVPQNILREKVFLPMNVGLDPVEVRIRLLGDDGTNMKYIEDETGISVLLCGIGSGMLDTKTQQEIPEPLHFYIEHPNAEQFNQAKDLVVNLAQTILSQMQQEQQLIQAQPQPPQTPAAPPHIPQDLVAHTRPPPIAPQIFSQAGLPPPLPHMAATAVAATVNGSSIIQPQTGLQAQIAPYAPQIVIPPPTPQLPQSSMAPPMSVPQPGIHVTSYQPPQSNAAVVITSHPVVNHTISAPQVAELAQTPAPSTQVLQISVPGTVNGSPVVSQQLVQTSSGPQLVQIPHGTQIISTPEGPRLVTFATANPSLPAATFPVQSGLTGATSEIQASVAVTAPQSVSAALAPQPLQYIPSNPYSAEPESVRFNSGSAVFSTAPPAQTTSITYFQPSAIPPPDPSATLISASQAAVSAPSFIPPLAVPVQQSTLQATPEAHAQVNFAQAPLSHHDSYQVPIGSTNSITSVGALTCTTTTLNQPTITYQDSSQQVVQDWRAFPGPRTDVPVHNFAEPQPDTAYSSKPNETVISITAKDSLLPWAQYTQSSDEVDDSLLRTQANDLKSTSLYAFPPRLQRPEGAAG